MSDIVGAWIRRLRAKAASSVAVAAVSSKPHQPMLGVERTAWGLNSRAVDRAVNVLKTRELIFCRDV